MYMRHVHYAPYLDYRPLAANEPNIEAILDRPECAWITRELEQKAQGYAVAHVVPEHLTEVRDGKLSLIGKTEAAVKDRLTKEITYWDHRAEQLKLQEQAGRPNARLNSGEARKRADNLQARLQKRLEDLKLEAQISPLPPVVLGGFLVVPKGLLAAITGTIVTPTTPTDTQQAAAHARAIVMEIERNLGFEPTDREFDKLGYDIESRVPGTGKLRFIEVKGRVAGAPTFTNWFDDLTDLGKVDWDAAYAKTWRDTVDDMDRQRRKQAEFLVYQRCDWAMIHEIGVLNDGVKSKVQQVLAGFNAALSRPVDVRRECYY